MVPGSVRIGTLEGAAFVAACLYALFLAAYVAVDTRGLRQLTSRVLRARAVGWVPLLLLLAVLACDVVEAMEDLDRLGPRLVFRDFFRLVTGLAGDAFAVFGVGVLPLVIGGITRVALRTGRFPAGGGVLCAAAILLFGIALPWKWPAGGPDRKVAEPSGIQDAEDGNYVPPEAVVIVSGGPDMKAIGARHRRWRILLLACAVLAGAATVAGAARLRAARRRGHAIPREDAAVRLAATGAFAAAVGAMGVLNEIGGRSLDCWIQYRKAPPIPAGDGEILLLFTVPALAILLGLAGAALGSLRVAPGPDRAADGARTP